MANGPWSGEELEIAVADSVLWAIKAMHGNASLDMKLGEGGANFDAHSILDLYAKIEDRLGQHNPPITVDIAKALAFKPEETARGLKRRIVDLIEKGAP